MKTDKSSRFAITTEEEYRKMGEKHVRKDKVISRSELRKIGRVLNGHTAAWAKIHGSGESHGHKGRIISSKTSHSENTGDLHLFYKDHKETEYEVRPVATGNTSNS